MNNKTLAQIIQNNIRAKNLEEGGTTILDDILALQTGKQDKLIAGNNITIDADGKTINAVSGDIVIYDNENGASSIGDIALEIGAVYEIFITSAINSITKVQYGQQKITIKLIPAESIPKNYDLYMPVYYFDTSDNDINTTYVQIHNYNEEFWTININYSDAKIYKIIKKAV